MTLPEISEKHRTTYLARRRADLLLCEQALAQQDFKTILIIGHKIKGNGATFGFLRASEIGALLESAAQEKNGTLIRSSLQALAEWIAEQPQL